MRVTTLSQWNRQYASAWTKSSIDCYKRGCNCRGCYIQEMLETPCLMKYAVMELVKKLGAPPDNELGLTPQEQKVIDAILAGASTKVEIAQKTGLTIEGTQACLSKMYELAENDGVVYKNLRYKLPDFINWVREGKEE